MVGYYACIMDFDTVLNSSDFQKSGTLNQTNKKARRTRYGSFYSLFFGPLLLNQDPQKAHSTPLNLELVPSALIIPPLFLIAVATDVAAMTAISASRRRRRHP